MTGIIESIFPWHCFNSKNWDISSSMQQFIMLPSCYNLHLEDYNLVNVIMIKNLLPVSYSSPGKCLQEKTMKK